MVLTIYCDLDGVLVDFDKKVRQTFNVSPEVLLSKENQKEGWEAINQIPHFWYDMEWTKDGKKLWSFLQSLNIPVKILTTPAPSVKDCKSDKLRWVDEQLGDVQVIFAQNKEKYANSNSILIDDRFDNIEKFNDKGGIGIQYQSAEKAINKIKQLISRKASDDEEIMGSGDWLTLKKTKEHYEYVEGLPGVVILPIRVTRGQTEILLRQEPNHILGMITTLVSGRWERGENFLQTAIRELKEETGYDVDSSKFREIGSVFYSKIQLPADIIYLVSITNEQQNEPSTDGTTNEKLSSNIWIGINDLKKLILTSSDGTLLSACSKLLILLEN